MAISNRRRYGLSAYLFTRDIQKLIRRARRRPSAKSASTTSVPKAFRDSWSATGKAASAARRLHGLEPDLKKKTVYVNYSDGPTAGLMPYSGR